MPNGKRRDQEDVTSDQVLVYYNPESPIVLTTDSSNNAVSGISSHSFDGELKPIAFVYRALSKREHNYSTLEKEAVLIFDCVTKLKQYLLGIRFTLRTDLEPLLGIFGYPRWHSYGCRDGQSFHQVLNILSSM